MGTSPGMAGASLTDRNQAPPAGIIDCTFRPAYATAVVNVTGAIVAAFKAVEMSQDHG